MAKDVVVITHGGYGMDERYKEELDQIGGWRTKIVDDLKELRQVLQEGETARVLVPSLLAVGVYNREVRREIAGTLDFARRMGVERVALVSHAFPEARELADGSDPGFEVKAFLPMNDPESSIRSLKNIAHWVGERLADKK